MGIYWTAGKRVTWASGESLYPAIAVATDGRVHLVWNDDKSGNREIYHRKSYIGGDSWLTAQRLTWNLGNSSRPSIDHDTPSWFHVAWHDDTPGNFEIYYRKSTDEGATWGPTIRLTWNSGDSFFPSLAIHEDDTIHLAWQDGTPGNFEIYYKKSTDGGATWTAVQNLTLTSSYSGTPRIAAGFSPSFYPSIQLVWSEGMSATNWEIYHKKNEEEK